jgi:hypothetical protein
MKNYNFQIWFEHKDGVQRHLPNPEYTEEEAINLIVPKGCENYCVVKTDDFVPAFARAYSLRECKVTIDIEAAKEIQRDKFRTAREPIFKKLDLEYFRADEQGDLGLKKKIAERKQKLRDVTLTPLPDDLFELSKTWPDILDETKL